MGVPGQRKEQPSELGRRPQLGGGAVTIKEFFTNLRLCVVALLQPCTCQALHCVLESVLWLTSIYLFEG